MSELKTLKNIDRVNCYECDGNISPEKLKAEAVKWVNADLRLVKSNPLLDMEKKIANRFIKRWMERLDITEEDLKDENS